MPRLRRSVRLGLHRLDERINPDGVYSTLANGMPILNSRPAAPVAIFMDFDGDATTSTQAYSEDADGATFNLAEQANMYEAWRQLSAYFAMFDADVTTVQPADGVPKNWLALGNNISGGYAYVGAFPNTYPRAFNQSSDARTRVSGLAHEVGHNFGLNHHSAYNLLGEKTAEYIGQADPLHGIMMGVDYAGLVHKFAHGHPTNSPSALQDDLLVMANRIKAYQAAGGDGYRVDDVGGTAATATPLTAGAAGQSAAGVIERLTDVDVYSFAWSGPGRAFVAATPDYPSGVDLKLELVDGAGTLLAAADSPANAQRLAVDLAAGTYYLKVAGHGNYADIGAYTVQVATAAPQGWAAQDIGGIAKAGLSTFDTTTAAHTVTGGGAGIAGTADGFQFVSQALNGNGSITARVTGLTGGGAADARAGVMIRDGLAATAPQVSAVLTANNGTRSVVRSTAGGSTGSTSPNPGAAFAPRWVRVARSGSTFTTSFSTDGVAFTTLQTATVNMGTTVYVGLAVSSHNNEEERAGGLNTATFTDVVITGFLNPAPPTNALAAPALPTVAPGTGSGLVVTWAEVAGAAGYAVERSADGVEFARVGVTSTNLTYTDPGLPGSARYFYRVRATNAAGQSVPSAVVSAVNRPSAVTGLAISSWTAAALILNWRDTDGETGYRVERSTDGTTFTTLGTVGVNVPSYTATGLAAGTAYTFRVTPTSGLGDGVAASAAATTRPPAVAGLAVAQTGPTRLDLTWAAAAGAASYRIDRSTDGTTFTTLTTVGATTYGDTAVAPLGEYYYRVYGVNSAGGAGATGSTVFAAAPAALTAPWAAQDIGAVSGAGTTGLSAGTFTVVNGGGDIWNTADAFRFTYQSLVGDGSITARVAVAENTAAWAKLGVMVRESLAADSKHVVLAVTPASAANGTSGNGVTMQTRSITGGGSVVTGSQAGVIAPYWVRLVRRGNVLTGFSSADGVTWAQVGAVTFPMAQTVYVGLAASAGTTTLLNTSTFTDVSVVRPATVAPVVVGDGTAQRSRVTSLTVTFSGRVTLPADPATAFVLTGPNGPVPVTVDTSGSTATQTVVKLTFAGSAAEFGSLADGRYTLRVRGDLIVDAGFAADGDGDGLAGGDRVLTFHRLFGDGTGDATVDGADFLEFVNGFGLAAGDAGFAPGYDATADGLVDGADFLELVNRFGVSV